MICRYGASLLALFLLPALHAPVLAQSAPDILSYSGPDRQQKLVGTGITPLFPLWQRPTDALAREMIAASVETYLVCVDLKQLPKSFAGRRFDAALLADLPASADPCGEKGEFHSCVVAGPMFSRRIDVTVGETIERDGFAYTDLIPPREAGRVDAA